MKVTLLIHSLLLAVLISACGTQAKEGVLIPPVPTSTTKERNAAALSMLSDAISRNPNNAENYQKRALIYLHDEKPTEALSDIDQAISIRGNVGRFIFTKSLALRQLGKIKESLSFAEQAQLLKVESPEFYTLLGDLYQQNRQYSKATQYLNRSIQIDPNDGENYHFKGIVSAKLGDTTLAINWFQKSVSLKNSYLPNYIQLSGIYANLREYPLALAYCNSGLKFHPSNSQLYLNKGTTYLKSWKVDSAMICYQKAVALSPKNAQAAFITGNLFFKMGDFTNAIRYYEKTMQIDTKTPTLNYQLGLCFEFMGQNQKALEFYAIAKTLNPYDGKAVAGYWRVQQQLVYAQNEALNNTGNTDGSHLLSTPTYVPRTFDTTSVSVRQIQPLPSLSPRKLGIKTDSLLKKHLNTLEKIN